MRRKTFKTTRGNAIKIEHKKTDFENKLPQLPNAGKRARIRRRLFTIINLGYIVLLNTSWLRDRLLPTMSNFRPLAEREKIHYSVAADSILWVNDFLVACLHCCIPHTQTRNRLHFRPLQLLEFSQGCMCGVTRNSPALLTVTMLPTRPCRGDLRINIIESGLAVETYTGILYAKAWPGGGKDG